MNRTPERDDLLADLLTESAPTDFRAALLTETLRQARRRRWKRRASRAALVAAMACAIGLFVWRKAPHDAVSIPPRASYVIVRTRPLPPTAIVSTGRFSAERIVSTFTSIGEVRTRPGAGSLRIINDDELLALAAPRIPALIRTGPHTQELIFLAPAESDMRRVN